MNFWMTESDERDFVERLVRDDVVWSPYALPFGDDPVPRTFDEWTPSDDGQDVVVVRRAQWSRLEWRHISRSQFSDNPDFKKWTMVGSGPSPAFEWDACERAEGIVARGRIYFQTTWLKGDSVRGKDAEAIRWFDRLTGWLRRRGKRWEYNRQYLMPDFARAMEEGELEPVYSLR